MRRQLDAGTPAVAFHNASTLGPAGLAQRMAYTAVFGLDGQGITASSQL
jgi:hypothetical protein